ncbi:MAG: molybdopterin molybdotransferase MoeA [Bryobacterales bacterium]|nr:molybdopterin molybdotransferase MoeA [Bryobacterales bacterium]MBV9400353.1 molybdopterin molybdotransferase MoeA [Bryobacterales bacterium]
MTLTFEDARACVLRNGRLGTETEPVCLLEASGRVLSEPVVADRDYPPFHRSARDGFSVRAADLPGALRIAGEVRAGDAFHAPLQPGEAVEIMTGAPLPAGADAVVMVEHTARDGDRVRIDRTLQSGDNFTPQGTEARAGEVVLSPGRRLGFAEIAALAMVGRECVNVYRKPRVSILPTGDEIVEAGERPKPFQIRNSNALSLAAQVMRAGGEPAILPIARDNYESTRSAIERGLQADLLLLSGGVSAGKYDIVEKVLADVGAEFFFDRVKIQPGQPLVYGAVQGTQFFGLPGNPASTMVTFEVFARAAVELLAGANEALLPLLRAKLSSDFRHKPGLTRFLPAAVSADGTTVAPVAWHGSGDIAALARANAFLVAEADRETWEAGEDIRVLLK